MRIQKHILAYACLLIAALCTLTCKGQEPLVVIYGNGNIYTCDDSIPHAEAMAVSQGKILHIGTEHEMERYRKGEYEYIDLGGKTVLPGFIESHAHPASFGFMNAGNMIAIDGKASKEEILLQLKEYLKEHPDATQILGQGYGLAHLGLPEGETPTASDLDKIATHIPIVLYDEGCHSGWVNSMALSMAHVDENTLDPLPGVHVYVRYPGTRKPTGYLRENTVHLVANALPSNTIPQIASHLEKVLKNYTDLGFTGVVDAGDLHSTTYEAVKQLRDRDKLNLYYQKAYWADQSLTADENISRLQKLDRQYSGKNFYCNSYKMFMDGTLEAETASLLEPYSHSGKAVEPFFSKENCTAHVTAALKAGYSVHVHAIGDKGQQYILDAFSNTRDINPCLPRIIAHNQVFEPEGVAKYISMKSNLFCQTTPSWAGPDAVKETLKKLGKERFSRQYLWGQLASAGVQVTFGSDYPANLLEEINPFRQLWHAVIRTDSLAGYFPPCDAGLTVQEGVKAYTIYAARQMGLSDITGSLKAGKNADFIIIDRDIFTCKPEDVKNTKVLNTYFQGRKIK